MSGTGSSRTPEGFLILLAAASALACPVWNTLLNNCAVERAGFGCVGIGILQRLREVSGFLASTTVFVLLVVREPTFALLAVMLLGLGVTMTALHRRFGGFAGRLRPRVGGAGGLPAAGPAGTAAPREGAGDRAAGMAQRASSMMLPRGSMAR